MPVFEYRTSLPCTVETAFDFLSRPANVASISPPEIGLVFVDAPDVLAMGSRFSFRVQAYGQPVQFEHEVTSFDRPRGFRERMVKGPLARWDHEYLFEADGSLAVLTNRIDFEPPGGMLGMFVTAERMLDQMETSYAQRAEKLQRVLAGR
jgi:ligand-binding SRPBCC domain-containing protein